jgi:hydroxyacylglutathione hydrolase
VSHPQVAVLRMQLGPMKNFSYVVTDPGSRRAVVVDPAWQMEKVEDALAVAGAVLCGILVTHSHPDHIHLAAPLSERHGCPIWMSEREIELSGYRAPRLRSCGSGPRYIGAMQIWPVATPGHTPGCLCYLIGDNLFSGDVLFYEGCGMCPDMESAHTMFRSLQYLKRLLKPSTRVFPGHSYGMPPGQQFAQLLRDNLYLQFSSAESFAAFRMRRPQRPGNIFGQ